MTNVHCPTCPGIGVLLGVLGNTAHYRCRQCGYQWGERVDAEDDEPEFDDSDERFGSGNADMDWLSGAGMGEY